MIADNHQEEIAFAKLRKTMRTLPEGLAAFLPVVIGTIQAKAKQIGMR